MMLLGTFTKQPGETLDYDIDLSDFLPSTDYIVTATSSIEINPDPASPTTLTLGNYSVYVAGNGVKQWVSAGNTGKTYQVQVKVTTFEGRVIESEFKLKVKEI